MSLILRQSLGTLLVGKRDRTLKVLWEGEAPCTAVCVLLVPTADGHRADAREAAAAAAAGKREGRADNVPPVSPVGLAGKVAQRGLALLDTGQDASGSWLAVVSRAQPSCALPDQTNW